MKRLSPCGNSRSVKLYGRRNKHRQAAQRLAGARFLEGTFALAAVFLLAMTAWLGALAVRRVRRRGQIRLRGTEVSPPLCARGLF